jgi:hypothetical protein
VTKKAEAPTVEEKADISSVRDEGRERGSVRNGKDN